MVDKFPLEFPLSYRGKTLVKPFPRHGVRKYELIEIDFIPSSHERLINTIWSATAGLMTSAMDKKTLGHFAKECSNLFYETLPWEGFVNAPDYVQSESPLFESRRFYDSYLKSSRFETPDKLSRLALTNNLNCVGQSLLIKESIQDSRWGLAAQLSGSSFLQRHHTLAGVVGDYIVLIDPVVGFRDELSASSVEDVYVYSKERFSQVFIPTDYIV